MIKLEHVVLPSAEQIKFVIEGMRNPLNSWNKSDSIYCNEFGCGLCDYQTACEDFEYTDLDYSVGKNDLSLMNQLAKAGTDHRKFMRMIPVMVRITAPLYWWKEMDTYKVGTVANSCSTMHKIQAKEFTLADFSHEKLVDDGLYLLKKITNELNFWRGAYLIDDDEERRRYILPSKFYCNGYMKEDFTKKSCWWQMIQLLPSSYNQTRNVMLNYEVLANIYRSRRTHKLDEWVEFCKWIETLPYAELITGIKV